MGIPAMPGTTNDTMGSPTFDMLLKKPNTFQRLSDDIYVRSNLTRLQTVYWIGYLLRGKSPVYNTIYTYTIEGDISEVMFVEAFNALVRQTDSLRVVFMEDEGIPRQQILDTIPGDLEIVDFSRESSPEDSYRSWLQERASRAVDLSVCSYDSALVRISDQKYLWYYNQHHILVDANSFIVLFRRLAENYSFLLRGEHPLLTGCPQFMDYVKHERASRLSSSSARAEEYWGNKLSSGSEPLIFFGNLPTKSSTHVRRLSYDLGESRSRDLRAMAHRNEIFSVSEDYSLYCLLGGLFFLLLHQLSGSRRLGLITPLDNRMNAAFQRTAGLLLDFYPLIVELDQDGTLQDLIARVKREMRAVVMNSPFGYAQDLNSPVFDVMFNTYAVPALELEGSAVLAERVHPGHGTESLALHVTDMEATGNLVLHFDLHEDVFPADKDRQEVMRTYIELLESFLKDPARPLSAVRSRRVKSNGRGSAAESDIHLVNHLDFESAGKVPPKDLLEFQIFQAWRSVFGEKLIGVNDDFFALGGNSWLAVRLLVEIERLTGKYLPLTSLLKAATIAAQAKVIRQETGGDLWSSVITIQPGRGKRPIYFAPGAAENGLAVARIARHLGEERPVFMFQIPLDLADNRAEPLRLEDIAENYVAELLKLQPAGPYLLGGYSAGGLVALEAAQQLKRQGHKVDLLVVIDVPAQGQLYGFLRNVIHQLRRFLCLSPRTERKIFLVLRDTIFRFEYFIQKGSYEMLEEISRRLARFLRADPHEKMLLLKKRMGVGDSPVTTEIILPGSEEEGDWAWMEYDRHMREHFNLVNEAVKCYVPQPYDGRVLLFRSTMGYRRPEMRMADPLMGWKKMVRGKLDVHVIPGNHLKIVREPAVKQLGEILRSCLDVLG